jgi:hypothetical protein
MGKATVRAAVLPRVSLFHEAFEVSVAGELEYLLERGVFLVFARAS